MPKTSETKDVDEKLLMGGRVLCPFCATTIEDDIYSGHVCHECDARAVGSSGQAPWTNPPGDEGENPIYIDGRRCFRRYRFGGWVTMVDDCGCRDVIEFQDMHITGERMQTIVVQGIEALERSSEPVRSGFDVSGGKVSATSHYRGTIFENGGRKLAIVRTALVSDNAQLIDAAVAYRIARSVDFVVAILDPPKGKRGAPGVTEDYRSRYREAAWHGLHVAWLTKDEIGQPWKVSPTTPSRYEGWLRDLVVDVRARLAEAGPLRVGNRSRAGEMLVRPHVHAALAARGFHSAKPRYTSFWRKPTADGVWERTGEAPRRVALEVKVTEDVAAPFCQVMENLGFSDAVLYVRILNATARKNIEAMRKCSPEALVERARFEALAPVKYIEIG